VPVVLRKVTSAATAPTAAAPGTTAAPASTFTILGSYEIIRPTLIHGIMQGEALDMLEQLGAKPELIRLV
jgi:hypothetical protein